MTEEFDRTIELKINGMTCGNCVSHVTSELKEIETVTEVSVILDANGTSSVLIVTDADISNEILKEAVDEAGDYEILEIIR